MDWLIRKVLLAVDKYKPKLVAIEGYSFGNYPGTAVRHELYGALKRELLHREALYIVIPPKSVKKKATGNGNASKMDMIVEAKVYVPGISTSDEADAFHIARIAFDEYDDLVEEVEEI